MDISRRQFLKKTSSSPAFGVAISEGLLRPISAAAQAAAESSDKIQRSETGAGYGREEVGRAVRIRLRRFLSGLPFQGFAGACFCHFRPLRCP
jgi:hypothetical protein